MLPVRPCLLPGLPDIIGSAVRFLLFIGIHFHGIAVPHDGYQPPKAHHDLVSPARTRYRPVFSQAVMLVRRQWGAEVGAITGSFSVVLRGGSVSELVPDKWATGGDPMVRLGDKEGDMPGDCATRGWV